jgi:hypothetical protein
MKTRYIQRKNFIRLVNRLKSKMRYGEEYHKWPYESDAEYKERMEQMDQEIPMSIRYYGRFHTIEFFPK